MTSEHLPMATIQYPYNVTSLANEETFQTYNDDAKKSGFQNNDASMEVRSTHL